MATSVQTISRRLELYEVPYHRIDIRIIGLGTQRNDIIINDVPKFLMKTLTPDSHSIVAHDINNPLTPLVLTLYIHGVTSWLTVSKPSIEDWNYMKYQTIELTAEQLDWEPNDTRFQESE